MVAGLPRFLTGSGGVLSWLFTGVFMNFVLHQAMKRGWEMFKGRLIAGTTKGRIYFHES